MFTRLLLASVANEQSALPHTDMISKHTAVVNTSVLRIHELFKLPLSHEAFKLCAAFVGLLEKVISLAIRCMCVDIANKLFSQERVPYPRNADCNTNSRRMHIVATKNHWRPNLIGHPSQDLWFPEEQVKRDIRTQSMPINISIAVSFVFIGERFCWCTVDLVYALGHEMLAYFAMKFPGKWIVMHGDARPSDKGGCGPVQITLGLRLKPCRYTFEDFHVCFHRYLSSRTFSILQPIIQCIIT